MFDSVILCNIIFHFAAKSISLVFFMHNLEISLCFSEYQTNAFYFNFGGGGGGVNKFFLYC